MENNLAICDVYKSYKQGDSIIHVLKGVSAFFEQGNSYAITGISGSGKSTLIQLLAGLDLPTKGKIVYGNNDINEYSKNQKSHYLNQTIGLMFQYPYLVKELTVLENVMIKGLIAGIKTSQCDQEARELLQNVSLTEKINAYPGQLSGGQQQRVALARALMNKPQFLLADEPTGNLDPKTAQNILDLITKAQKEWNMGLIISSHDRFVTDRLNTLYEMVDGLLAIKR